MAKPFDYSKWNHIELSDDEDDLHPNIDKDSWFRMKHRSRLEREEKEDEEKAELATQNETEGKRVKELRKRLARLEAQPDGGDECEDIDALQAEITELQTAIDHRERRIHEINERRKWNIENICKVKEEKTVINRSAGTSLSADDYVPQGHWVPDDEKSASAEVAAAPAPAAAAAAPAPAAAAAPVRSSSKPASASSSEVAAATVPAKAGPSISKRSDRDEVISYNDFVIGHEDILEAYADLRSDEDTKEFLVRNGHIVLHEHGQAYILLSSLEDEMNGKHDRAMRVCRQSQFLTHITELGTSLSRDPRDVVRPFFKRIEEKQYRDVFETALEEFTQRIQKRAVEKRKEMNRQSVMKQFSDAPGPGGLHPEEVYETLPQSMQDAFASQDVGALHAALATMPRAEARNHMRRCVASGLWVPSNPREFEHDDDLEEGEEQEEGAEVRPKAEDKELQKISLSGDPEALDKYLSEHADTNPPSSTSGP